MAEEKQPLLSVIIPAYNEEHRIGKTLEAVDTYLSAQHYDSEILVVNDGSKDNTASVVEGYRDKMPRLRLIANPENHGKGYVVRQGMLEAKGQLRLFTDADNATPIEELEKLLPHIKAPKEPRIAFDAQPAAGDYDVVIGSIGLSESEVERAESGLRQLAGKIANLLIQVVVLPGIHDTQRGFKLFTAKAAEDIFSRVTIERWGFDIEALALARKLGYRIKEVPIHWIHDPDSRVSGSAYIDTLLELVRIRIGLWTGKYK